MSCSLTYSIALSDDRVLMLEVHHSVNLSFDSGNELKIGGKFMLELMNLFGWGKVRCFLKCLCNFLIVRVVLSAFIPTSSNRFIVCVIT